jgi:hypothetical protein
MIIQVGSGTDAKYFLAGGHTEMRLSTRPTTINEVISALENPDRIELNPRGREEYIKGDLKVIIDDDEEGYFDGIIVTVVVLED